MSGLCELPMYPTLPSFRPPSGMRCDSRLLSSFITGALTATTVTLFLLRVVPGTYVVLPCDPTITARPVLMEEYFDHIEKQEVFPEDSLIDTRPLHSHGVKEAAALHSKKSRLQKKKKKKTPPEKELSQQKLGPKANTKTTKEAAYAPKDLQQQLKDLQERERLLKGSVWSVDVKQQPKQKKKMQEQIQIRQHLEEIQLHLQKQSEEIQRKLDEEKKAKAGDTLRGKYGVKNSLQKLSTINSKHPVEQNEIPARKKRASHSKKNYVRTNSHNKTAKHQRPPDYKLLRAIIKEKGVVNPKGSDPLGLYTNNYNKLLPQDKENHSYRLSKQEFPVTKTYARTITPVPKFSQNVPLRTESSQLQP